MNYLTNDEKNKIYNLFHLYGHKKGLEEYQIKLFRRHLAAYRIQKEWFKMRYNPYHPVGRKYIEKTWNDCFMNDL